MYDFSVYTPILGNDPRETIYAERSDRKTGKNFTPVVLWTNDLAENIRYPVIRDSWTSDSPAVAPENIYYVLLTYKAENPSQGNNKTGLLTYYLNVNGSWDEIDQQKADLSGLSKPQLYVHGEYNLPLECSTNIVFPEIPEPPTPEPDLEQICRYFPEPIQGWKGAPSTLTINNRTARATGWSDSYLAQYTVDRDDRFYDNPKGDDKGLEKLVLTGFEQSSDPVDTVDKTYNYEICGTALGCDIGNNDGKLEQRKAEMPIPAVGNFGNEELIIDSQLDYTDYQNLRPLIETTCEASPDICSFEYYDAQGSKKSLKVQINSNLSKLTINKYGSNYKEITVVISDDLQIGKLTIPGGNGVIVSTPDNSEITLGEWDASVTGASYSFGVDSKINVTNTATFNNLKIENNNNLMLYGPDADFTFTSTFNGQPLYWYILGRTVNFETPITINGAVTSQNLTMKESVLIQKPDYSCNTPPPTDDDYTLVLTPESDIALVCEDIASNVSVKSNGQLATDFTGNVVLTIGGVTQTYSNASKQFTVESGGSNKVVLVKAYIEGRQAETLVTGSYEFVPYKLAAEDQYVIAGKKQSVEVKALACNSAGSVKDMGYDGSPTISSSWFSPYTAASDLLTYAPSFNSGTSDSTLMIDESGKLEVTLEDSNFDCTGITGCPIEGNTKLKGNFMVYSRPWAFALCNYNGTDIYSATGTSSGGNGFIAAGEEFDLQVLPIKYQSDILGEVESNRDWCNASHVTSHFFLDNSFSNHVKLSSAVASPIPHTSSDLLASHDATIQSRVSSNQAYDFTKLYWNDVGSLKVMATTGNYNAACSSPVGLESWYECTQRGYRNIGRFYPKYFQVYDDESIDITNSWAYPDGQSFTYMGQGFGAEAFYVEALNAQNGSVSNYKLFDESLQAEFNLIGNSSYATRFSSHKSYGGEWQNNLLTGVDSQSIGLFTGSASDGLLMTKDTVTYAPDGPFNLNESGSNTDISIDDVSANADPVEIDGNNGRLAVQPDIRFGRVNLDDVGGRQGDTLHVPLRVEYWNGSRFVVNSNDSQTDINGIKWDQVHIWPTGEGAAPKDVTLGAGGEVSSGSSRSITAKQAESYRQQTRVWLDLEANDLPWLKYDWDNEGEEENPSSVVTFGIHRGNDRVIYRGEPGLTAQ
ncbi:hypothetical protein BA893_14035 [Vibrio natriegens]|uniref:DUF6701 domain-containing protein n=1 Tax=Vibrio natriegens TaxID=691 RepID=UPI0008042AD1|nr:DUF6701 domain-containing protein [Vibrio natriegens]ANQ22716.1 hypothetical protein BA893_14035 [Vibrio natriegens]